MTTLSLICLISLSIRILFILVTANMVVVERTLAIVKPDAVHRTDEIIEKAQNAGFIVLQV
jgi:hypothetical protein